MEELEPAEAVKEVVGSIDALTAPAREFVAGIPALLIGASAMVIGVLLCLGLNWLVRRALLRATRGAESGFLHEVVRRVAYAKGYVDHAVGPKLPNTLNSTRAKVLSQLH